MKPKPGEKVDFSGHLLLGVFFTLLLFVHVRHYFPYITDDALISFRYAERLLQGKGLTWTEGIPVEGYSNLLWILLLAFLGLFRIEPVWASRILGFLSMSVVIFALLRWHARRHKGGGLLAPALGLLFFSMSGPVGVWTIAGLEAPLCAALIALSISPIQRLIEADAADYPRPYGLSLILGLLCITRPDGPVFSVAAFFSIILVRVASRKQIPPLAPLLIFVSGPLLFYGGQLIFRIFYYGEIVPNTALVKIAPGLHYFTQGALYVLGGLGSLLPASFLALAWILFASLTPTRRSLGIPLLLMCGLWFAYLIFIGGDHFPAYRHFVPIVVLFAFALTDAANGVIANPPARAAGVRALCWGFLSLLIASFLLLQVRHPRNAMVSEDSWEWDGKVIGLLLKRAFGEQQPLIAVTAAGCIPYWSGLPALDMLGLNDHYLPRHPPEDFGEGTTGHELGDGDYILRRQPDLICFHMGGFYGVYRPGRQLRNNPAFTRLYVPVPFVGFDPREHDGVFWILKYSPLIGIRRTPEEIRIPGYLLVGPEPIYARLNAQDKLVLPIPRETNMRVVVEGVSGADWIVQPKGSGTDDLQVVLRSTTSSVVILIRSESDTSIELEEIVLTRGLAKDIPTQ